MSEFARTGIAGRFLIKQIQLLKGFSLVDGQNHYESLQESEIQPFSPPKFTILWDTKMNAQLDSCRAMELGRRLCQVVLDTLPVPQRDGGPVFSAWDQLGAVGQTMIGWWFRLVV